MAPLFPRLLTRLFTCLGPPKGPAWRDFDQPTRNARPNRQVVLTGGKLRKEIYAAFEQIFPVLQEFRKSTVDAPPVAA